MNNFRNLFFLVLFNFVEPSKIELLNTSCLSFSSVYVQWMYLIPLGLIVMNAVTQALNMPEEQATGQPGSQGPATAAVQRGPPTAVRRR